MNKESEDLNKPSENVGFDRSSRKLEFDSVLDVIAGYARSERTRERVRAMRFMGSTVEVEKSQEEIIGLAVMREGGDDLPLSGWIDSWNLISRINAEGLIADAEELVIIADGERKAADVRRFMSESRDRLPLLSGYVDAFKIQEGIIKKISKTIGPRFEILDGASAELSRLRRRAASLRDRLRKKAALFASRKSGGSGEGFVTLRGERFVVSLPRSKASGLKGIVHQESGSGASLFVEPIEFIEENNTLESLIQEERAEIERILRELTSEVFSKREYMMRNQDIMVEIDGISAKAHFASVYRCIAPRHSTEGLLSFCDARHPLLEKRFADEGRGRKVAPLNLVCESDLKALVISGPNAGGKTVALKTIGLLVIMDRAGLPVPCTEGTVIADYSDVFADIGDDQSIAQSLSTFSSQILWISRVLEVVNEKSLVLIDEIGHATDPEEGGALAEAVLEHLIEKCGRVMVTTHLTPLKGWAHERSGADNAMPEFDSENLEPLYSIRRGIPGRSWGIEMAGRLGLARDTVELARSRLGSGTRRFEDLVAHLEREVQRLEAASDRLTERERRLKDLESETERRLEEIRRTGDEQKDRARREALEIVTGTQREMENLVREIRSTRAERKAITGAKAHIRKSREELERRIRSRKSSPRMSVGELKPGMLVEITGLDKVGRVISVESSGKVYLELEGGIRVETGVGELAPAIGIEEKRRHGTVSWTSTDFEPVTGDLMVRGMDREDALREVDRYIDRAVLQGSKTVTIIHGIGRGILKRAIYDYLKGDPRVRDMGSGEPALGGDGVVVVKLK